MVSGWSFVTHPRQRILWFIVVHLECLQSFRIFKKPSEMKQFKLGTHWFLGSLVVPRFETHPWPIHWDAMKLAIPRLSMQSLRCLDWFCSVIDCRKYPGAGECRFLKMMEFSPKYHDFLLTVHMKGNHQSSATRIVQKFEGNTVKSWIDVKHETEFETIWDVSWTLQSVVTYFV